MFDLQLICLWLMLTNLTMFVVMYWLMGELASIHASFADLYGRLGDVHGEFSKVLDLMIRGHQLSEKKAEELEEKLQQIQGGWRKGDRN